MFALFFSLYYAMFTGTWTNYQITNISSLIESPMKLLVKVVTNIFNGTTTPISDFTLSANQYLMIASFVLALITSIGIVVVAVKGVKRAFGIFFMGIRR